MKMNNKIYMISLLVLLVGGCGTNIALADNDAPNFIESCSLDLIQGIDCLVLSSHNPDVDDSGSREDIWEGGGLLEYMTTAETLKISSTSADDDITGTGLRTLFVSCLDENYNIVIEVINLSGLTNVTTSIECLRPRFIAGVLGGSDEENIGTIKAISSSTGKLQMVMSPQEGLSKNSHFTVPANHTATIRQITFGATKTGGQEPIIEVKGKNRFFGTSIWVQSFDFKLDTGVSDIQVLNQPISNQLIEKTDIRLEVTSSLDNTDVLARTYVIFREND